MNAVSVRRATSRLRRRQFLIWIPCIGLLIAPLGCAGPKPEPVEKPAAPVAQAPAQADKPADAAPTQVAEKPEQPVEAAKPNIAKPTTAQRSEPTESPQLTRPNLKPVSESTPDPAKSPEEPAKEEAGCGHEDSTPFPPPELSKDQTGTPRFVCESKEVESKPVWAGEQLTFPFKIRNEGTADLAVKLKGG